MGFFDIILGLFGPQKQPKPRPPGPQPPSPKPIPPDPQPPPATHDLSKLFDILNRERQNRSRLTLRWNDQVAQAAQFHSDDMATYRRMSHMGSNGSSFQDRLNRFGYSGTSVGEIIAETGNHDEEQAIQMWIHSPMHAAIMFGVYTECGCGWNNGYWTIDFGSP